MQRVVFYPKPSGLPGGVTQTTEELLARLAAVLTTNAPIVSQALQPGLSDTQISALEAQGGFHLSEELRAFYRWHNGMLTNQNTELLPGQRFLSLDEIVRQRTAQRQQVKSVPVAQRLGFEIFAGHRKNWVQILDDGGGDGYFYDPERTAQEGAFFYHFAEVRYFLWFPSFRNFLAGTIQAFETKAIKVAADGLSLDEDQERIQKIWDQYAKSTENGG